MILQKVTTKKRMRPFMSPTDPFLASIESVRQHGGVKPECTGDLRDAGNNGGSANDSRDVKTEFGKNPEIGRCG